METVKRPPMDARVKKLWVDALRSGKFKQGQNYLTHVVHGEPETEEDCCMGVLCKLAKLDGVPLKIEVTIGGMTLYDGISDILPPSVMKWAGLESNNPAIGLLKVVNESTRRVQTLGSINDEFDEMDGLITLITKPKYDFNYIADLIEKEL